MANVNNFDGQILSSQALVDQYKSDVVQYTQRLKIASDVENTYQPMLTKGYVSKLQVLTATDNAPRWPPVGRREKAGGIECATMAALKAQRDAYIQQWYSDTGAQLVLDKNDLDTTKQGLDKAQKMRDLVTPRCAGGRDRRQSGEALTRIRLQRRRHGCDHSGY